MENTGLIGEIVKVNGSSGYYVVVGQYTSQEVGLVKQSFPTLILMNEEGNLRTADLDAVQVQQTDWSFLNTLRRFREKYIEHKEGLV